MVGPKQTERTLEPGVLRDPMVVVLLALLMVLMPLSAFLVVEYRDGVVRHFEPPLPGAPTEAALRSLLAEAFPKQAPRGLTLVHEPLTVPRDGVLQVYGMRCGAEGERGYVAIVRHDILCGSCEDLLLAVVLDGTAGAVQAMVPIHPWHVDGQVVDAAPFLDQWVGRALAEPLRPNEVDGISGATRTTEAVVREMYALRRWVATHEEVLQ